MFVSMSTSIKQSAVLFHGFNSSFILIFNKTTHWNLRGRGKGITSVWAKQIETSALRYIRSMSANLGYTITNLLLNWYLTINTGKLFSYEIVQLVCVFNPVLLNSVPFYRLHFYNHHHFLFLSLVAISVIWHALETQWRRNVERLLLTLCNFYYEMPSLVCQKSSAQDMDPKTTNVTHYCHLLEHNLRVPNQILCYHDCSQHT